MIYLEYLQVDSAGPYINTGIINDSTSYFEITFEWLSTPGDNYGIIGAQNTSVEYGVNAYQGDYFCCIGQHQNRANISNPLGVHTIKADANSIYVDNVQSQITPDWTRTTGRYYYIFAINYSQFLLPTANTKIYECKIWSGDTLVRHFKPAQDGSNIGMYDEINGVFYVNAGTGSFVAGPALNIYTVQFNANGGTGTMPDQSIEIDTPTPLSTNQYTKDRSVFVGWSESASGPVQYTNGQAVTNLAGVGETVTLYAIWEAAPLSIILQSNTSEKNKVDKDITNILTLAGTLRQETSILDPVILIEGSEETILTANYLTIPDFGRSYFITGFRSIRKGLIEISCHVDVLYSYKDTLRQQKAIIKRNTSNWNLYLNDGSLTTYQDPYVLTEPFPAGFTGQTFVLAVAGS